MHVHATVCVAWPHPQLELPREGEEGDVQKELGLDHSGYFGEGGARGSWGGAVVVDAPFGRGAKPKGAVVVHF